MLPPQRESANGSVGPAFSVLGGFIIFIIAIVAIGIAGFIMFMYAMYSLSNYYKEPAIFKNVLYAFIVSLVSGAVVVALEVAVIISAFAGIFPINTPSTITPAFTQIILTYAVVFVVAIAFGIVNGVLYMRAFNKLKEKSGVDNFGTAGLLYLIGVFIPLIGWIAWIFAAMGFNKLKAAHQPLHHMFPILSNHHYQPQHKPSVAPTAEQKTEQTHYTAVIAENHYNKKPNNKQVMAFTSHQPSFHKNFISLCVLLLNSKL